MDPKLKVKPALQSKSGGVNQKGKAGTSAVPSDTGVVVRERKPDVEFETFVGYRARREPVPRDELFRRLTHLQKSFTFPPGRVHIQWGVQILMDRAGLKPHITAERLATYPTGGDLGARRKGPSHVFFFIELVWLNSFDKATGENRRAWTIVQFHRAKKFAIHWDLCPGLNCRDRVTAWALQSDCAFSRYMMQYRSATPDVIPANE